MMPTGPNRPGRDWRLVRVSILVLLDDAYRQDGGGYLPSDEEVSILVLLDDAYRLWVGDI